MGNSMDQKILKSRSYFIELVYEEWNFNQEQSKLIDILKSSKAEELCVFNEKKIPGSAKDSTKPKALGRKQSTTSPNKIKEKTKKDVLTSSSDFKNAPKYNCTFIMDREMAEEINIKIDDDISEWIKKEKLSWQALDTDNSIPRHERAAKARADWLEQKAIIDEGEENEDQDEPKLTEIEPKKKIVAKLLTNEDKIQMQIELKNK